jgi:hypothetical protein
MLSLDVAHALCVLCRDSSRHLGGYKRFMRRRESLDAARKVRAPHIQEQSGNIIAYNDAMIPNRKLVWALLASCAIVAIATSAYPLYVIRPFRAQGAAELAVALALRIRGPAIATAAAILALLLSTVLWRTTKLAVSRAVSTAAALLTIAAAALSHVNVYEIMFHRIDSVQTMPVSEAKLDADDMVLAVSVDGQSRAYPIRMMGYHHVVNDRLGGLPIVATY